jgi:hypothetical protein
VSCLKSIECILTRIFDKLQYFQLIITYSILQNLNITHLSNFVGNILYLVHINTSLCLMTRAENVL